MQLQSARSFDHGTKLHVLHEQQLHVGVLASTCASYMEQALIHAALLASQLNRAQYIVIAP